MPTALQQHQSQKLKETEQTNHEGSFFTGDNSGTDCQGKNAAHTAQANKSLCAVRGFFK